MPPGTASPPATPAMGGARLSPLLIVLVLVVVAVVILGIVAAAILTAPTGGLTGVRVLAPSSGCWTGGMTQPGSMFTVSGCGPKDYAMACGYMGVSLMKQDAGTWTLTVQIMSSGRIVQQSSTSSPYGAVSVTGTC